MLYKPIQIVVSEHHTILISKKVYVWGANHYGQLGLGDWNDRNSPQELLLYNIESIACGVSHTIALVADNQIYSWGYNRYGQLGLGDGIDKNSPTKMTFHSEKFKSIVCGGNHTVALTFDKILYVWGQNISGQLGLGDMSNRYAPQKLTLDNIESISCGELHTIALSYHNDLYVWGSNDSGQLGLGDYCNRSSPQKLKLSLSNIKSISCRAYHNIALTFSNEIYSWGWNYYSQLIVNPSHLGQSMPHEIGVGNIKSVGCGWCHTIVTTTNGLYIWGHNSDYQLGLVENKNQVLPQDLILKNINTIVCGKYHVVAVTNTNDVYVWGSNRHGELGLGDDWSKRTPFQLNFEF